MSLGLTRLLYLCLYGGPGLWLTQHGDCDDDLSGPVNWLRFFPVLYYGFLLHVTVHYGLYVV